MLPSGMLEQLQTNLLLSFVLNGATTDTSGKDVPNPNVGVVRSNIENRLANLNHANGLSVAWGPSIALDPNGYACNVTVVLRGSDNCYRVVTSGTNPDSPYDIDDEDNAIVQQQPLDRLIPTCLSEARISQGTWDGVTKVLNTPSLLDTRLPFLAEFLLDIPANSVVQTMGHSLGGALASVLALYFSYICPDKIHQCNTFGAPTAGNSAFAAYFDNQMEERGIRVFNTLDTVPCGWNAETLKRVKTIYQSTLETPTAVVQKIDKVISQTGGLYYTQPGLEYVAVGHSLSLSLPGSVDESLVTTADPETVFELQTGYQHNDAYIILLALELNKSNYPTNSIASLGLSQER